MTNDSKYRYLVIGAGHQGLAMAAHFSLNGEWVHLWNRTKANIEEIMDDHLIICDGVVSGNAHIQEASSELEKLITNTIFITTPSTAYKNIAGLLAAILLPETVIFLNPGRTFGAIEFMETLVECSCRNLPTIVETQSIIYTCRRMGKNRSYIYALKDKVKMAYIGHEIKQELLLKRIPQCIRRHFTFVPSVLETSLGNIGMILHCAPVLMNVGWIESPIHEFHYYYDGISPSIGKLLEKMDRERTAVAKAIGVETISLIEWFEKCYSVQGASVYECIQKNKYYKEIDAPMTIEHRYLDEDVPNGLVPVEFLGKELGIDMHYTTLVIDLAEAVRNIEYRKIGRRYSAKQIAQYVPLDGGLW